MSSGREVGTRAEAPAIRRAFTLVELLVTVSVIGILASMLAFAMFSAQESARDAKTRSVISKIDALMAPLWNEYRTRRVPVNIPAGTDPKVAAATRLRALREMMRMELPDRWSDIVSPVGDPQFLLARPAVSYAYLAAYSPAIKPEFQSAECLYLIVTRLAEDGAERFGQTDFGDVDSDGAPEILDGWGNPIHFIRWPAGFQSELQSGDPAKEPDPFDPLKVDPTGYMISPLIYSGGPNEVLGIDENPNAGPPGNNNPFAGAPKAGTPRAGDEHLDNIHNHYIGRRTQ